MYLKPSFHKFHRIVGNIERRMAGELSFLYQFHERKATAIRLLKPSKETFKDYRLTKQNRKEIKKLWNGVRVNEDWFRFFNSIKRETDDAFDARYIPMDFSYTFLHPYFNNTPFTYAFDDKNMYDLYFHDISMPRTICRVIGGVLLNAEYNRISQEEALALCREERRVIIKPAGFTSNSGRGIIIYDVEKNNDLSWMKYRNCIVQELIKQHPDMALFHSNSVNTIRMVTFYDEKRGASVLGAVVRMGANGSVVDNASQGGLFCGIHDDGKLTRYGYNRQGKHFISHPNGIVFENCRIPNYNACKEMVLLLANRFIKVAKLIAWDLAIDEKGDPLLIEINLPYSAIDLMQISIGPLFGDQTEEIIRKVMSKKKNRVANRWLMR